MRGKGAMALLMLPFLIAGFIIPERTLGADVVLKNIRFGQDKSAIRVVLDFEGQPRCQVSTSLNGDLSIELPMVSMDRLRAVLKSTRNRYPGWISEINAVMDKGKPTLKIRLSKGVSLVRHGAISKPARLYLDFKKQEKGLVKPPDISALAQAQSKDQTSSKDSPSLPSEKHPPAGNEKKDPPSVESSGVKEPSPKEPPPATPEQMASPNPQSKHIPALNAPAAPEQMASPNPHQS